MRNIDRFIKISSIFRLIGLKRLFYKFYLIANNIENINKYDVLCSLIDTNDTLTFLEIGVYQGNNIIPLSKKYPLINFIGVDAWSSLAFENYYKGEVMSLLNQKEMDFIYESVLYSSININNLKYIRGFSHDVSQKFEDESLDMIFIDAAHDYTSVKRDLLAWYPKLKVGGILSGHDYSLKFFGVVEAVNEIIGYDNISIYDDDVFVHRKRVL